jgi:hypothetical protein
VAVTTHLLIEHVMRRFKLRAFWAAGLSLLLVTPSAAQTEVGLLPSTQERLIQLFSTMKPRQPVQLVTPLYFVEDGRFESLGRSYVEVTENETTLPFDLADIRSVSVRSHHQIQGAIWGGAAGILIGGVTGMMVASFDCQTLAGCQQLEKDGAIRWATIFGAGGAIGGLVIGRFSVYWKPIFP